MKRHNLQPAFRESSDSLRRQAASTNLPMPFTTASGNGVYALAFGESPTTLLSNSHVAGGAQAAWSGVASAVSGHWSHRGGPTVLLPLNTLLHGYRETSTMAG